MVGISLLEFADKLDEIMPVLVKEFSRRQAIELYKGKITVPQFLALGFLHSQGESKMSNLAKFMRVSTAAMTGIIDRLVRDGYALRQNDPGDRRIIKVKLTDKGNVLIKKIYQQRKEMIIKIFGKISETDRYEYLRILMQVKEILTQGNGGLQ